MLNEKNLVYSLFLIVFEVILKRITSQIDIIRNNYHSRGKRSVYM